MTNLTPSGWLASTLLAALVLAVPSGVDAQGVEFVKANYTKYEYRVPMRDGTRLFTAVYVPKDESQKYPILLKRTPYNVKPYGVDQYPANLGPSPLLGEEKYVFAYQDVRGRWMSEGEFVNMRPHVAEKDGPGDFDESSDAWDTIDWLVKHVPNNGRVGMWGTSYPGFYTSCGVIDAHPALQAATPQAPISDWFVGDDWHHNGAFFLPHCFNFMAKFGHPRPEPTKSFDHPFDHGTPDGYRFFLEMGPLSNANARYFKDDVAFWNELQEHPDYDDFWRARNLRPHLRTNCPAVMTVGGWFDAENLFGALETYRGIEGSSPRTANTLVMGPWRHGGWNDGDGSSLGHVSFNAKTSEFYRESIERPFFEFHLKGKGDWKPPEAWVFETGTNDWQRHDEWPPGNARSRDLYLRASGELSFDPPPAGAPDDEAFDEFTSDPAKPVPSLSTIAIGMTPEYMVDDQRFAASRPDVLVYATDVLDRDVTIAGPLQADLVVSTTGTDADWVVKLIDVYPDDFPDPEPNPTGVRMGGFQQLVRGEVMRGRFRNDLSKPEPFEPGRPTSVRFTLPDTLHTFRPGHRIMVQIQSSWFPLVDRNPQTFVDVYRAKESDFRKAIHRVHHSAEAASRIRIRVLP